ncbi:MAG: PepSY-associated TM helix domain-containing protein, partial [Brevundimonas sp.]
MSGATNAPLSGAYRVVWRWHFYAGLLVLPFLMMLALTGGLYLFASEIDDLAARPLNVVTPGPERVSADRWVAAARVAADGQPVAVRVPDRPDRAVQVVVQPEDGSRRAVFVNPYDGQVSGVAGAPLSDTFKRIHSLEIFGGGLNVVIEIVAGWAIILVATGV